MMQDRRLRTMGGRYLLAVVRSLPKSQPQLGNSSMSGKLEHYVINNVPGTEMIRPIAEPISRAFLWHSAGVAIFLRAESAPSRKLVANPQSTKGTPALHRTALLQSHLHTSPLRRASSANMLRQFSACLPGRVRASGSRLLARSPRWSLSSRRSMASVGKVRLISSNAKDDR